MKILKVIILVSAIAAPLFVASPASARQSCEPRVASTYRYSSTGFRYGSVLRLCEDLDTVTYETELTHENLVQGTGIVFTALGVAECPRRTCVVYGSWSHEAELAGYQVRFFWFGIAEDQIGPLVCATVGARSGCREAA